MILLDTNVLSEPMKPAPNARVIAWLDAQQRLTLHTTAINQLELWAGVNSVPRGKRRTALAAAVETALRLMTVLPFDSAAALECASRSASARRRGRTVLLADAQIGAIAAVHGLTVATRDVGLFQAMSVPVIDPWKT